MMNKCITPLSPPHTAQLSFLLFTALLRSLHHLPPSALPPPFPICRTTQSLPPALPPPPSFHPPSLLWLLRARTASVFFFSLFFLWLCRHGKNRFTSLCLDGLSGLSWDAHTQWGVLFLAFCMQNECKREARHREDEREENTNATKSGWLVGSTRHVHKHKTQSTPTLTRARQALATAERRDNKYL